LGNADLGVLRGREQFCLNLSPVELSRNLNQFLKRKPLRGNGRLCLVQRALQRRGGRFPQKKKKKPRIFRSCEGRGGKGPRYQKVPNKDPNDGGRGKKLSPSPWEEKKKTRSRREKTMKRRSKSRSSQITCNATRSRQRGKGKGFPVTSTSSSAGLKGEKGELIEGNGGKGEEGEGDAGAAWQYIKQRPES